MKGRFGDFLPTALAALGLAGFAGVFASERRAFREAVEGWALRDLRARTELAAGTLREPLEKGDFRRIHAFGDECTADGTRVTVFGGPGGIVFDSAAGAAGGRRADRPEVAMALAAGEGSSLRVSGTLGVRFLYCARRSGDFVVRLALPAERVHAPVRRARAGFVLAGLSGGAGVLLVALVTHRQRTRLAELARERDAQARLVEELRKVEEFRRDFIADVSHELKTPLTGILGAADLLQGWETLPPGDRTALLGMLKRESARLNALAQGILSLARLERAEDDGGTVLSPAEADLADVASGAVEALRPRAEAAGVELKTVRADPCPAFCDAQLVEQAVSNLVENAIRHSGSPTVEVSVEAAPPPGRGGTIAVEDRGTGIPEAERERVFERFHRADPARAAESGGAGLGLAIVRRIARLHGGDVALHPVSPSGCRFELRIAGSP